MTNLILSFDLVDNQFRVTINFKVLWRQISKVLYLATLLEEDFINENARGRI